MAGLEGRVHTSSLRFASTPMSRCSQWRTKRETSPGTALSGGVFLIGRQSPPCGSGLSDDLDASGFGMFETCRLPQRMSGYRGRPGVSGAWLKRRNRPSFRTSILFIYPTAFSLERLCMAGEVVVLRETPMRSRQDQLAASPHCSNAS
jgi:hypothetical protein